MPGTVVGETEVLEVAVEAELGAAGAVVVGTDVVGAAVDMEAVLGTVPVDTKVPAAVDPLVGGDARFYRAWNWFPCYQNTLSKSPISREQ